MYIYLYPTDRLVVNRNFGKKAANPSGVNYRCAAAGGGYVRILGGLFFVNMYALKQGRPYDVCGSIFCRKDCKGCYDGPVSKSENHSPGVGSRCWMNKIFRNREFRAIPGPKKLDLQV